MLDAASDQLLEGLRVLNGFVGGIPLRIKENLSHTDQGDLSRRGVPACHQSGSSSWSRK